MLLNNNFVNDYRVYREAKTLVDAGHEVTILALRNKKGLPEYEEKDGIKIKRVFNYDLNLSPNLFKEIKANLQIVKSAKRENADIYHAHDLDTLIPAHIASKANNSKLIYDSHELWWSKTINYNKLIRFSAQLIWRVMERMLIKKADIVITVNNSIASFIEKNIR